MPHILGSTAPVEVKSGVKKFRIGIIADLDKLAKGEHIPLLGSGPICNADIAGTTRLITSIRGAWWTVS